MAGIPVLMRQRQKGCRLDVSLVPTKFSWFAL